jgi:hypothetical protein
MEPDSTAVTLGARDRRTSYPHLKATTFRQGPRPPPYIPLSTTDTVVLHRRCVSIAVPAADLRVMWPSLRFWGFS